MKLGTSLALVALSSITSALPASKVQRADSTDNPVGYASLNGGTTGGAGGTTTTVSSLSQFTQAAKASGIDSSSGLEGVSLYIKDVSNVIVRNLKIAKVKADTSDAVSIQKATNVWVDHLDLSSDLDNGKDYYDGLVDITHAADYITVSNTYFHDHYKSSLVGHSDSNGKEDSGHLRVTYANNYFKNTNSRLPSVPFGTVHVFNSYYEGGDTGVNTRMGAQVLVESSVFEGVRYPVCSRDSNETGSAVTKDVVFGSGSNTAPKGSLTSVPYKYSLLGSGKVKVAVVGTAGNTIRLG